jgi:hypothetical protein
MGDESGVSGLVRGSCRSLHPPPATRSAQVSLGFHSKENHGSLSGERKKEDHGQLTMDGE